MADDALAPFDPNGFSLILHYSPEMVAELAMGAEHPHEIAERYGVDAVDYEHLAAQEWFGRLVAQKRHEFHDTGMLFIAKAGMMAEALLTRLFQQSMAGSIPAPLTVEVAKQLTDIGRLKPQPLNTQPGVAGNGFAINIQVNGADVIHSGPALVSAPVASPVSSTTGVDGPDPVTKARADALVPPGGGTGSGPTLSLDFVPPKGKPPASLSGLRVPDFDLRPNPRQPSTAPGGAAAAFGLPPTTTSG
jgi:hypothetical protein